MTSEKLEAVKFVCEELRRTRYTIEEIERLTYKDCVEVKRESIRREDRDIFTIGHTRLEKEDKEFVLGFLWHRYKEKEKRLMLLLEKL
jgi:hypothetical protein